MHWFAYAFNCLRDRGERRGSGRPRGTSLGPYLEESG